MACEGKWLVVSRLFCLLNRHFLHKCRVMSFSWFVLPFATNWNASRWLCSYFILNETRMMKDVCVGTDFIEIFMTVKSLSKVALKILMWSEKWRRKLTRVNLWFWQISHFFVKILFYQSGAHSFRSSCLTHLLSALSLIRKYRNFLSIALVTFRIHENPLLNISHKNH